MDPFAALNPLLSGNLAVRKDAWHSLLEAVLSSQNRMTLKRRGIEAVANADINQETPNVRFFLEGNGVLFQIKCDLKSRIITIRKTVLGKKETVTSGTRPLGGITSIADAIADAASDIMNTVVK